jgi:hypothetical protein
MSLMSKIVLNYVARLPFNSQIFLPFCEKLFVRSYRRFYISCRRDAKRRARCMHQLDTTHAPFDYELINSAMLCVLSCSRQGVGECLIHLSDVLYILINLLRILRRLSSPCISSKSTQC